MRCQNDTKNIGRLDLTDVDKNKTDQGSNRGSDTPKCSHVLGKYSAILGF